MGGARFQMVVGLQLVVVRIIVRTVKSQLLSRDLGLWSRIKESLGVCPEEQ
jgi:hypothetical protein